MKRKRDKKYLLTFGTGLGLLIVMIISLSNKNTYSTCLGINSSDNQYCCQTKDIFSDDGEYSLETYATDACNNYALSRSYEYYTCNISEISDGKFKWDVTFYTNCR